MGNILRGRDGDGENLTGMGRGWGQFFLPCHSLNSTFHPSGVGKSSNSLLAGVKAFTHVRWQVTLCDPIWQVTPHSSRTGILSRALFGFVNFCVLALALRLKVLALSLQPEALILALS